MVYQPEYERWGNYVPTVLPERYDAFLFIDKTRALHPAADCFRGLGYRIADARLQFDRRSRLWRCFAAERGDERVRVCERIVDAQGESFVDASSWFWAATLGRSKSYYARFAVQCAFRLRSRPARVGTRRASSPLKLPESRKRWAWRPSRCTPERVHKPIADRRIGT